MPPQQRRAAPAAAKKTGAKKTGAGKTAQAPAAPAPRHAKPGKLAVAKKAAAATPPGRAALAAKTAAGAAKAKAGAAKAKTGEKIETAVPSALYSTHTRQLLLGEYALCLAVLAAGTLVAPKGSADGVTRLLVKGTGLSVLFLLLGLVSAGGRAAGRAAVGFGALVTVTYLFSSSDAADVVNYIGGYFSPDGLSGQAARANPGEVSAPFTGAGP
jgi:hypothetical protein